MNMLRILFKKLKGETKKEEPDKMRTSPEDLFKGDLTAYHNQIQSARSNNIAMGIGNGGGPVQWTGALTGGYVTQPSTLDQGVPPPIPTRSIRVVYNADETVDILDFAKLFPDMPARFQTRAEVPNWIQDKVMLLQVLPVDSTSATEVGNIGKRITQHVFWVTVTDEDLQK